MRESRRQDARAGRGIEEACYWLANRPPRTGEALEGDIEADVAIVGAGFTGLWTAIALLALEPSLSIAILERERVAYGASGRNAGIVGETLDHSPDLAIEHFGLDEARELSRLGRENLEGLEAFLSENGIEAGLERTGQLITALTSRHVENLKNTLESAHRLGLEDWRWLSKEEAQVEVRSPLYLGALLAPRNALVDPVRLSEGLARAALGKGSRLFEKTRVTAFARLGDRVEVRTGRGSVRARKVALATNAYSHQLRPGLLHRFIPLYDYIVVSDPLTDAQRGAIGWQGRQGLTDARAFFNYARPTSDGRILWGTSEAVYHRGNRVDASADHSPAHYAGLAESFHRHFPEVGEIRFPYAWGGPIASTTRLTPFFGKAMGGRLAYALGYTGHGIGTTRLAGRILAHMLLDRESPLLDLAMVRKPPVPYPPEPLRGAAVAAVTRSLRRLDAGGRPDLLLRVLDAMGIGFSS